jgi:large subunit ribosomal protein L22
VTAARTEVQAVAKFVHVSPRKARLVADHIRGRSVPEARTILAFTPRAAAHDVEKVLRSAIANAYIKHQWDDEDLYVKAVYVDVGPTLKRWRARARGRVNRILKRTCHITVRLDKLEAVAPASRKPKTDEQPKAAAKPRARKRKAVAS